MKNLLEIAKIVTKKKVKKIEIFDDAALKNKNSKFNEFYEALMSGKFKNDRDAATLLYDSTPTDDKYRQLKSRFRKRLLNTLFFLDVNVPSSSGYDRAYYSCNKDWTLAKILLENGAEHTAADISRGTLVVALRYNFSDIIVNCSRILRSYASKQGNNDEFEEYDTYIKQYYNVLEAEIRSEELYQRVMMKYLIVPSQDTSFLQEVDVYCEGLISLSEQYNSPIITYNMYLVWVFRYEMSNDFSGMLEVCKKADDYMEQNPHYKRDDMAELFNIKKMSAYLHLQDFKNGRLDAEHCLKSIEEGSESWFQFMEYYFLLAMHTENYFHASSIFNTIVNNNKYKKLPSATKEKWVIFELYMDFFIEQQAANNPALNALRKKGVKNTRIQNESPNYPKDIRVYAVYYLIAQCLHLLEKGSHQQVADKIERLRVIALRQLKQEDHYRTINFIKLLHQLSKADFKVENLSNVEKYYNRLVDNPFFYRGLANEMETIPYEKLWNIILADGVTSY